MGGVSWWCWADEPLARLPSTAHQLPPERSTDAVPAVTIHVRALLVSIAGQFAASRSLSRRLPPRSVALPSQLTRLARVTRDQCRSRLRAAPRVQYLTARCRFHPSSFFTPTSPHRLFGSRDAAFRRSTMSSPFHSPYGLSADSNEALRGRRRDIRSCAFPASHLVVVDSRPALLRPAARPVHVSSAQRPCLALCDSPQSTLQWHSSTRNLFSRERFPLADVARARCRASGMRDSGLRKRQFLSQGRGESGRLMSCVWLRSRRGERKREFACVRPLSSSRAARD